MGDVDHCKVDWMWSMLTYARAPSAATDDPQYASGPLPNLARVASFFQLYKDPVLGLMHYEPEAFYGEQFHKAFDQRWLHISPCDQLRWSGRA